MENYTVTAASEDRIEGNPASGFDRFADLSFHRMHNNLEDRVKRVGCRKHVYLIECDACSKDCWQLEEHNLHSNWETVSQFVDSGRTSCSWNRVLRRMNASFWASNGTSVPFQILASACFPDQYLSPVLSGWWIEWCSDQNTTVEQTDRQEHQLEGIWISLDPVDWSTGCTEHWCQCLIQSVHHNLIGILTHSSSPPRSTSVDSSNAAFWIHHLTKVLNDHRFPWQPVSLFEDVVDYRH